MLFCRHVLGFAQGTMLGAFPGMYREQSAGKVGISWLPPNHKTCLATTKTCSKIRDEPECAGKTLATTHSPKAMYGFVCSMYSLA